LQPGKLSGSPKAKYNNEADEEETIKLQGFLPGFFVPVPEQTYFGRNKSDKQQYQAGNDQQE